MNPRRLAGSRQNKHLPIARIERPSDIQDEATAAHRHAAGWVGPDGCGAECACGVTYDGFDRLGEAVRFVERHIVQVRFGGKPDHAARAVDIRTIWPPLTLDDSTAKRRKAAEAGARGVSAAPMSRGQRAAAYQKQTGRRGPTARQARQLDRMDLLRAS